jgi:hypothetical protein
MATNPLVEQTIDRDLPVLIKLALNTRGVPVSMTFWVHSPSTGQWQVVVISDLVDQLGTREAYKRVFAVLDEETFSTKNFLASHILLLGERETREAQVAVKRGTTRLPSLGPFEDVDIYFVPEPEKIPKQGFLHFSPIGNGRFRVSFAPLDKDGAVKNKLLSLAEVDPLRAQFSLGGGDKDTLLDLLGRNRSASVIAQTNLRRLYSAGLI